MNCDDFEYLKNALMDGELDSIKAEACAEHQKTCPSCRTGYENLLLTRDAIRQNATRHAIPGALSANIARMIAPPVEVESALIFGKRYAPLRWAGTGAFMAMAACLAFIMAVRPDADDFLEQQLLADHIRSLQEGHLTDVISTDQHTVKPWFNGRLDVSPPVIDLVSDGFSLFGGRLDYADHHPVAAVVYRYNAHVINLFVWSSPQAVADAGGTSTQQGYNLRHWHTGDLQFWIVSDLNPAKLAEFESLYRARLEAKP
jgi:anti-sigma factor RsiW